MAYKWGVILNHLQVLGWSSKQWMIDGHPTEPKNAGLFFQKFPVHFAEVIFQLEPAVSLSGFGGQSWILGDS